MERMELFVALESRKFIPVSVRYSGDGRLEAVGVVSLVAAVAQQQRVLVLLPVTKLTARLNYIIGGSRRNIFKFADKVTIFC